MSAINPISGSLPSAIPSQPVGAASQQPQTEKASFGQTLRDILGQVDGTQHASDATMQEMLTGGTQDIAPVVAAAAKADISFKLLIGVRNKVIEAYKQTLNMPV